MRFEHAKITLKNFQSIQDRENSLYLEEVNHFNCICLCLLFVLSRHMEISVIQMLSGRAAQIPPSKILLSKKKHS